MVNPLVLLVPLSWAMFAGALLLSVLLGVILAYHWFRYAMNPGIAFVATVVYASVSGFLLFGILVAAIAIQVTF